MQRHFLFLQGPHGPFFATLARGLRRAGARVSRLGVTFGDRVFWGRLPGFHRFDGQSGTWEDALRQRISADGITDIVCYGATRPIHETAAEIAGDLGLTLHVFEEGYLRPYWITYERGGTNARSRLTDIDVAAMEKALARQRRALRPAPDKWGAMRQHMFWGAVYHGLLLMGSRAYPGYRPHRTPGPRGEFGLYLKHLIALPLRRLQRHVATLRVRYGGFPYHVTLLQLAHDANFRDNGPYPSQRAFLTDVFAAFSTGAPPHHHLVLKAHPLEDGREPLRPMIRALSAEYGLRDRVHLITGGKLARLLDRAESAVTVNSTAAEQVLWRGLPLKSLGQAIYNRPGFTSRKPLGAFFAAPDAPDHAAYLTYRQYLLQTSQIAGGFYSWAGRREAVRQLIDMVLDADDPYQALEKRAATGRQQIRRVA